MCQLLEVRFLSIIGSNYKFLFAIILYFKYKSLTPLKVMGMQLHKKTKALFRRTTARNDCTFWYIGIWERISILNVSKAEVKYGSSRPTSNPQLVRVEGNKLAPDLQKYKFTRVRCRLNSADFADLIMGWMRIYAWFL